MTQRIQPTHDTGFTLAHHLPRSIFFLVDADDKRVNNHAVLDMSRILSAYCTAKGVKRRIITKADRSSTCILLPDEGQPHCCSPP